MTEGLRLDFAWLGKGFSDPKRLWYCCCSLTLAGGCSGFSLEPLPSLIENVLKAFIHECKKKKPLREVCYYETYFVTEKVQNLMKYFMPSYEALADKIDATLMPLKKIGNHNLKTAMLYGPCPPPTTK